METKNIVIKGARQNNLKNLDINIPKNKIVVFTGVSGSGKSSLVFETIGAEAQRQMNESQNSFARTRAAKYGIPEVDYIEHLNVPVIINQKRLGGNARSTVGTATDIYSSLRLLFSRLGEPFVGYSFVFSFNHPQGMCPKCEGLGYVQTFKTDKLLDLEKSLNEGAILFPTFQPDGYRWLRYALSGYFDNDKKLKDYTESEMDLLLNSTEHKPKNPNEGWGKTVLYEGIIPRIEKAMLKKDAKEFSLRQKSLQEIISTKTCPECNGQRLNKKVLSCKINGKNIADCCELPVDELIAFVDEIPPKQYEVVISELQKKLKNLQTIGLQYLTLSRTTGTLSGGESQRIKMVKHLGNSLENLLYIFDEPSIGLHSKDLHNLSEILQKIRDKGNTVLIVEHDPDLIKITDHIIDMGPESGENGGEIIYEGTFENLKKAEGKTAEYFSEKKTFNKNPRIGNGKIGIANANLYNLENISVDIPKEILTVVTGVAGSGKSTLISKVLPAQYPEVKIIDQSIFTASARANLLTFLGISDYLRKLFATANNASEKLFSRNSEGACPNCKGLGIEKIDLAFMDDIEEVCEVCGGSGFNSDILKFQYEGKSIAEIYDLTVAEASKILTEDLFLAHFKMLSDLGLGYLKLGQRLNSLSGGERQRLKLTKELKDENNIIVLDEPSTGLHPSDTKKLMKILNFLVDKGNTLIVIEHNLDIIAQADWIIDVGPGAGKDGGKIVFEGTVEKLIEGSESFTAKYLLQHIS